MSASCAEFYWSQMLQYLSSHIERVEGCTIDLAHPDNSDERFEKLQQYAQVVTLYFEHRAMKWIVEVLVPALGIDTYYVVFEFAKGRGQIHFHLLAWLKSGEPHSVMHKAAPAALAGWRASRLDPRASVPSASRGFAFGACRCDQDGCGATKAEQDG